MYFLALATDYDDTLARSSKVEPATLRALQLVKDSGRRLILVTGRTLPDLQSVFPEFGIFDFVVAENGALLFDPAKNEQTPLAEPPPEHFLRRLKQLRVSPLSFGRAIVATREPNETAVLTAIRDLGLELQIIFNKGAVMVLPSNINKATGLMTALARMGIPAHNVVGIGDAENDYEFLVACGCAVAVDNAVPALKEVADWVTQARGSGVVELARLLVEHDLHTLKFSVTRVRPVLGSGANDSQI